MSTRLWTGRVATPYGRSRWEAYPKRTYRIRTVVTTVWPDTTRLGAVCILPANYFARRAQILGRKLIRQSGRTLSASIVS